MVVEDSITETGFKEGIIPSGAEVLVEVDGKEAEVTIGVTGTLGTEGTVVDTETMGATEIMDTGTDLDPDLEIPPGKGLEAETETDAITAKKLVTGNMNAQTLPPLTPTMVKIREQTALHMLPMMLTFQAT
jgi:hypothetical protein